jgi:hypothetical protein
MSQPSPALALRRSNRAIWIGVIFVLLGVLSNFLYFIHLPGQAVFPWLGLSLPAVGLALLLLGVRRAFAPAQMSRNVAGSMLFGQPQVYRGKIVGPILTVIGALVFGLSAWGFLHARAIPASKHAPQIGEKAPDFTLVNTSGQSVSLAELLSTPIDTASGKAPKGVLLIFYRGWW